MSEDLFDLVFAGELAGTTSLEQTKNNMALLFKISASQVDALFSGKPITLKKNLTLDAAKRYRVAIKKAGAKVTLRRAGESSPPEKKVTSQPGAGAHSVSTQPQVEPENTVKPTATPGEFEVLDTGSDILRSDERSQVPVTEVDTSMFDVRENTGNLVDEDEMPALPIVEVEELQATLSDVGDDLLKESEKISVEEKSFDFSHLSVAEPGADLGEKKKDAEVDVPNVDHITLAD